MFWFSVLRKECVNDLVVSFNFLIHFLYVYVTYKENENEKLQSTGKRNE